MIYKSYFADVPKDLHKKVANFIVSGSRKEALSFSKICDTHRQAIAQALEGKLALSDDETGSFEDWLWVTGKSIIELDTCFLRRHVLPACFRDLSSLREASLCSNSDQLRAIRNSPNLTRLSLVLRRNTNWQYLVSTVARLPLKELKIGPDFERGCVMRNICHRRLRTLPAACPLVASLDVSCGCSRVHGAAFPHWKIVTAFKALESLVIHTPIVESQIPFLRQLKDVQILSPMPIQKLLHIGPHVSTVWQFRRACLETVSLLTHFSHLRELRLRVLNGAEISLPQASTHMEIFHITWGYDAYYDEAPLMAYQDGNVRVDMNATEFYSPDEEVLGRLVRNAPNLKVVGLFKAAIKIQVVEAIMKLIGKRLEAFGVELSGQAESVITRLERILATAAQFCPHIKHIEIPHTHALVSVPVMRQEKEKCIAHLNSIKRNSPFFRDKELRFQINYLNIA